MLELIGLPEKPTDLLGVLLSPDIEKMESSSLLLLLVLLLLSECESTLKVGEVFLSL